MVHGCNVAIASRNINRVKAAANEMNTTVGQYNNTKCIYFGMDITNNDQVVTTVKNILKEYPRIDILINGAAGNFLCALEELSANAFKKVMEIDAFGTFYASKACFHESMKEHGGCIINITATLHYQGSMLQTHAGTAKAAGDAMIKHMANEWGQYNIRVNGIAPGGIKDTLGLKKLTAGSQKTYNKTLKDSIPLGRLGTKKEIADAAIFLCSNAAEYISGDVIVVDGGQRLKIDGFNVMGNMYYNNKTFRNIIKGQKKSRKKSKL